MEYVPERMELILTPSDSDAVRVGTIGPAALAQWFAILRPLGVVEVIDAVGEVVTPEEVQ